MVILNLSLAFLVLANNYKRLTNIFFASFVCSVVLWMISNYFANFYSPYAMFWTRMTFLGAILLGAFLLYFSFYFPEIQKPVKIWQHLLIVTLSAIFIFLFLFTKLVISGVTIIETGTGVKQGPLYYIWPVYFLSMIICTLYNLLYKYRFFTGKQKTQIKIVFVGLALSLMMAITTNLIFPFVFKNDTLSNIGPYSTLIFIIFTAYAIVETHLFDIRVIATEVLVVLIGLALLIDTLLSKTLLEGGLKGILFVLVSYGSYKLVQSVKEEIRRRQEIQKLTIQLKKDKEELQSLDRLKDEFLQMATHELNMPIASIQSGVSILEEMGEKDSTKRKIIDSINFNTQRLAALARDLLNVSRIESGRLSTNFSEVHLEDLIKQVVNDLEEKAKSKGNQLNYVKANKSLPKIYSDEGKIVQILNNLIGNAIKFTEKGKITVSVQQEDGKIITTISDTGVGIPKEALPKLFTKFYQVNRFNKDKPLEQQGTGLGLYITKKLVELLGGKIWVQSQEDKGSQFSFSLPIKNKRYNENEQKN
uniref:histidine kinase n=1 Tax=candidate division CPR3 bacterium TaxID=2268181 RepID=A0A7V3N607_UNCC3